jgi:DNA-binding IclR family transcriptional regulator
LTLPLSCATLSHTVRHCRTTPLRSIHLKPIGAVDRALDILDLFNEQAAELGIAEIGEATGLHKSTAAGLVYTLEARGYLAQNPANRKYRLGPRLVERATVFLNQVEVRQVAQSHLKELLQRVNESLNLGIRDGSEVIYIERLSSSKTLGMRAGIGMRAPCYCTALGKALLAALPEAEARAILERSDRQAHTPHTLTRLADLLADLAETRRRGFSLDDEENETGGRCVAAPVFDHTGAAVAAVSISAPTQRFPSEQVPAYGQLIRATALAISRELGYSKR